jgi:hypothetical protein
MSEILLLFLAQPVLYIPLLLAIAWMAMVSRLWVQGPCSINRIYESIAKTNDFSFLIMSVVLLSLIKVWYDIPITDYTIAILCFFYIVSSTLPSLINSYALFFVSKPVKRLIRRQEDKAIENSTKNKHIFKTIWITVRDFIISIPQRFSKNWNPIWKRSTNPHAAVLNKASFYRYNIRWHRFSESTTIRLKWIYRNPFVYSFLFVSCLSIILMTSANFWLAKSLRDQVIIPSKQVAFQFGTESFPKDTSDTRIFIGESQNYIFLYNYQTESSEIYPRRLISNLSIHVSHPSNDTMRERFKKGINEFRESKQ